MRATHSLKILAFVTLAAAGSAALAQLPEGVQTGRNGTEVMLTGQATLTQTNNEAVVNLYCTEIGADAADVARKVIEATNTGLTELKKLGLDARYETTQLSSWPHYSAHKDCCPEDHRLAGPSERADHRQGRGKRRQDRSGSTEVLCL